MMIAEDDDIVCHNLISHTILFFWVVYLYTVLVTKEQEVS